MQPESPPPAPAVVAVVVTCDPGPWFEEVLTALAAQDYPNLSVLVVDAGSAVDPTPRIGAVLPDAFVRNLDRRVGFGTAANEVLGVVEGASHYLFCHDDAAPEPAAIRLLVEEAFRSNAGIASPKYVEWDDPRRLVAVGMTTDRVGVLRNPVEPGELDQEQHDAVRDILVAPGGATLVRADLFDALGGFDGDIDSDGEDLDLSWRARLVGARLTAVPAARVRHLQAGGRGVRTGRAAHMAVRGADRRAHANRYRTLLTCYRWHTLAVVLPLALFWAAGETVTLGLQGRPAEGWPALAAFGPAVRHPRRLWAARRRVQKRRSVPDSVLRRMQVRGNTRLRLYLQARLEGVRSITARTPTADAGWDTGTEPGAAWSGASPVSDPGGRHERALRGRGGALVGVAVLFVLILGSRGLLGAALPQLGSLPDTSGGLGGIWAAWWSGWQPGGLGVGAPASPGLAMLGLLGTALFGAVGTLEHVVVLGPLLIGPLGAYRAARWWRSGRGSLAAAALYAAVPLPYNALSRGHWGPLVAYAVTPFVVARLTVLSGRTPLPPARGQDLPRRLIVLGILVAVVGAAAPAYLYLVPIVGVGLAIGSVIAGRPDGALRFVAASVAASLVALFLLLPWSFTVLSSGAALHGPGLGPAGRLGLGRVLTFHTGPFGGSWGWLLLVAAALPLVIGREWRLEWAARLWCVALVSFVVAWAGRRGWMPEIPVEVALAPAAAALAAAAALGASAFELDLPGYRFGWRQVAAATSGLALAALLVPFASAAANGRWDLPSSDARSALAILADAHGAPYRVLWVGRPDALPEAGRQLETGFAYATSFDGPPSIADAWPTGGAGAAGVLADDLRLAEGELTTKLGHLLAPASVRYIVIPNHLGPGGSGAPSVPVPARLVEGLSLQTDLRAVNVGDPDYTVYENAVWAPARFEVPGNAAAVAAVGADPRALQALDLSAAVAVLPGDYGGGRGPVRPGGTVYASATRDSGWNLDVGDRSLSPAPAFGWAMAFRPPAGAAWRTARLRYSVPFLTRAGDVVLPALWIVAIAFAVLDARRRRRTGDPADGVRPEWFVAAEAPPARRHRAPRRRYPPLTAGDPADEEWSDV